MVSETLGEVSALTPVRFGPDKESMSPQITQISQMGRCGQVGRASPAAGRRDAGKLLVNEGSGVHGTPY